MSAKEILRLRRKFIMIAMVTFALVMLFICTAINVTTMAVSRASINSTLNGISAIDPNDLETIISEYYTPGGEMPSIGDVFSPDNRQNHLFVFVYDKDNNLQNSVFSTNNSNEIKYVSERAGEILADKKISGRKGIYFYKKSAAGAGQMMLVMLDGSNEVTTSILVLMATVSVFIVALIITFVIVFILSGIMIRPEIENSIRQKEFITNASHELKTPLAVIRANTECTEMISGESEWTRSTLAQVDHMNGLIQNLVMIAKAQERENKSEMSQINISEAVESSISPYQAMAIQSGLTLESDITPDIIMAADESKVRQLLTILIDNAIKYCDENGKISIKLSHLRKGAALSISNSYAQGDGMDFSHFFDRFYREDKSHNIDKGGYGIGLSIAESIIRQMGGSISASWKDGDITFACVLK